jgi:hypothetical protein
MQWRVPNHSPSTVPLSLLYELYRLTEEEIAIVEGRDQ